MESVFEKQGVPLKLGGNKPLALNNGKKVWLVRSGTVDVFGVLTSTGKPTGPRIYLFRAGEGQLLFDMGARKEEGVNILAIGIPGSEILELGFAQFEEFLCSDRAFSSQLEKSLASWVTGLSLGVRKEMVPKYSTELAPGKEITVANGENVRPGTDMLWVSHREGSSYLMGRKGSPRLEQNDGFIPLTNQVWLQSEGKTSYYAMDTRTCLHEGAAWSGLQRFHALVLDHIAANWLEDETQERQRLNVKAVNEHAACENALCQLAAILNPASHSLFWVVMNRTLSQLPAV
jgi:hypothetical protein